MATQDVKIRITALDKTSGALRKIGSGLRALARPLLSMKTALAGVIGAAGIGLLISQSLKATDTLAKTASKIGTTTEALSALQFAGKLTGVEVNTMNMALQRFTRRASEAAAGTGEAKGAIRELGIDARELVRLPLDERMLVLADAFQNVKSESDKLRLAFKLFDSEGAALVNTLSQGRSGLAEMLGEARALGIVMSSEAAAGVESANDEFLKLSSIFKGIVDQTTAALAPALEYIVTSLTETLKSFGDAQKGFTEVGKTIARSLISAFSAAATGIFAILNRIIEEYNRINDAVVSLNIKYDRRALRQLEEEKVFLQELIRIRAAMAKQADLDLTAQERKVIRNARVREINEIQAADRILEIERQLGEKREEIRQGIENRQGITPITMKSLFGISQTEFEQFFEGLIDSVDDFSLALGKPPKAQEINIVNSYIEQLKLLDKKLPDSEDLVVQFANNTMNAFTTGFTNAITGAEKFTDAIRNMAKSVIDDLIKMAVQYYITQKIFGAIVGAFTPDASRMAGDGYGPPAPRRAMGGPVTGGKAYLVGERGPELFVPSSSGGIVPNNKLGGGGVVVNQTINVTTGVQQTVRAEIATLLPQISNAAKAAVADSRMRGGGFSKAMGVA